MQKKALFAVTAVAVVAIVCAAVAVSGCIDNKSGDAKVELLYSGAGSMPGLLSTGQVDGYIIWQPFVAVADVSGIGKVVSYSEDLPPAGTWTDHTCCVFGANSKAIENKELSTSLTALMTLANKYINDNPEKAALLTADWLFANQKMNYGDVSVSSEDVMRASIPTIKFSSDVTDKWKKSNYDFVLSQRELGIVKSKLASTDEAATNDLLYEFSIYESAVKQIEEGKFATPAKSSAVSIGYLPSDHDAPLFVLIKDWTYFKDNYNCYLKPTEEKAGKISNAELYINGEKVCDVKLVEGSAGPALMTLLQQNQIQYAVAGTPPFVTAIDQSSGENTLKILSPIMMNGSGLVVSNGSPAKDWNSFIEWVKARSAEGKNVVIADPQLGSIQDVQIKAALESSGIAYSVKSA